MRNETSTVDCGSSLSRDAPGDHLGDERRRRVPRDRELVGAGGVRERLRLAAVAAAVAVEVEADQRPLDGAVDDATLDDLGAATAARSR